MTAHDIILKPLVSEKSVSTIKSKKYAFKVHTAATKTDIKNAIQEIFGVKVASVNVVNYSGKIKRQGKHEGRESAWKKAYVQLSADSKSIEFFDSLQ
jgi:large subunit ribosomal protein L23